MTREILGLAGFDRSRVLRLVGSFLLFAIVFLFIAMAVPQTVGADHSYVVLSDSMSPSIKAGAVVFVSEVPTSDIQRGDVITYRRGGADSPPTTHRVVEVIESNTKTQFITQGDANEDPDPSPVAAGSVIGTVLFHIPLVGYVVSFANTQLGLLTMIVIPALLLVVLELRDFWRATADDGDDRSEEEGML